MQEARKAIAEGRADEELVRRIHERFTYRMHDLGHTMKTLLGRFTRWFNTRHQRSGTLWEGRFKSVLVEEGVAARAMATYIDLNPVRAGMVQDPALYRWSSYGEAVGGGAKGTGAKARAGLVRALGAHHMKALNSKHEILNGREEVAGQWKNVSRNYRMLLLDEGLEKTREEVTADGEVVEKVVRKGMGKEVAEKELAGLVSGRDVALARIVRYRVRYFSDGVALGSRNFVDGVFSACRERFGARRTSGARALRGHAAAAKGVLWSVRDLRRDV